MDGWIILIWKVIFMQINESKEKLFLDNYIFSFCICFFLLILNFIGFTVNLNPIILIILGIYNVFCIYKKEKLILCPLSVFSIIWFIIISICSYSYPLMRAVNMFEWNKLLLFYVCFTLGGILNFFVKNPKVKNKRNLNVLAKSFNILVLILSIFSLIMLYVNYGGIPLFAKDANISKNLFRSAHIWSFISYFGSISIIVSFINDNNIIKNKKFDFFVMIYFILLVLSAERFYVIITILMLALIFCKEKIDKRLLKYFLVAFFVILSVFVYILGFRGNASQKQMYFINTGIYNGNVDDLVKTEIVRYFGMQERVISLTYDNITPGYTKGTLTLSPILKLFGKKAIEIPDVQIYGYTSKSIITKLYCDFGIVWGIFAIILSFIVNFSYKNFSRNSTISRQYFFALMMVTLIFSFYAYIDNFIIFYLHFPIYLLVIKFLNSIK